MDNLLRETLNVMDQFFKGPENVDWVGSRDGSWAGSWEDFAEVADVEYDAGLGSAHVASDLVVVFDDRSWLERHEYDGSEGWEYKALPTREADANPFRAVVSTAAMWPDMHELNAGDDE